MSNTNMNVEMHEFKWTVLHHHLVISEAVSRKAVASGHRLLPKKEFNHGTSHAPQSKHSQQSVRNKQIEDREQRSTSGQPMNIVQIKA